MVTFTKVWYNNCKQLLYALRADWKCFRLAAYAATGGNAPIIPSPLCGYGIITAKQLLYALRADLKCLRLAPTGQLADMHPLYHLCLADMV